MDSFKDVIVLNRELHPMISHLQGSMDAFTDEITQVAADLQNPQTLNPAKVKVHVVLYIPYGRKLRQEDILADCLKCVIWWILLWQLSQS